MIEYDIEATTATFTKKFCRSEDFETADMDSFAVVVVSIYKYFIKVFVKVVVIVDVCVEERRVNFGFISQPSGRFL